MCDINHVVAASTHALCRTSAAPPPQLRSPPAPRLARLRPRAQRRPHHPQAPAAAAAPEHYPPRPRPCPRAGAASSRRHPPRRPAPSLRQQGVRAGLRHGEGNPGASQQGIPITHQSCGKPTESKESGDALPPALRIPGRALLGSRTQDALRPFTTSPTHQSRTA